MLTSSHQLRFVRSGFSLVELLVVISIIAVMTGLVVSGLFRNRDSNRLVAAEQMLVDTIRQARHTARSTSSPVELRIIPVMAGDNVVATRISGVTRVPIWGETFDGDGRVLPATDTNLGLIVGRSGNGWMPTQNNPVKPYIFERGQALVRGTRSEGFYIACQIRPPIAEVGRVIPIILIGDDDKFESSQCGLSLTGTSLNAHITTWHIEGWVRGPDNMVFVSSLNKDDRPVVNDQVEENLNKSTALHEGHAILAPDRWVELGLLYDGERLMLFADGRRVAVHHGDVPNGIAEGNTVFIGQNTPPIADNTMPPETYYANCPMDDVRLYRLGTSDVGELPGNIVLVPGINQKPDESLGYRILCHGDGRVEVYKDYDENKRALNDRLTGQLKTQQDDATLTLAQQLTPGTLQYAKIQIGLDGKVISSLVRAGQQQ